MELLPWNFCWTKINTNLKLHEVAAKISSTKYRKLYVKASLFNVGSSVSS